MTDNRSPWIHELDTTRARKRLTGDVEAGVAIVGAGIAGVSTAFFTLKNTDKSVALIERFRLAHGATGHNAGLVVAAFERPVSDIEKEFGFELTADALKSIDSGWHLLDEMYVDAKLSIPFSRFTEATGLVSIDEVKAMLVELDVRRRASAPAIPMRLIRGRAPEDVVEGIDSSLYQWVDVDNALVDIETDDVRYIAVAYDPGGAINSALFCQEIVKYLGATYPDRFSLYEETKVSKIVLREEGGASLDCVEAVVNVEKVVLCTNGFEDFSIMAPDGLELDRRFHKNVHGVVNYMSGYLVPLTAPPAGMVYYQGSGFGEDELYYYVTRRPYEYERGNGPKHNLLSVGGPQVQLADHTVYSFQDGYPEERAADIQGFLDRTYKEKAPTTEERTFAWHGLMGYTPGMIRIVGVEPTHSDLLYNLGCNGIGILPSIFGGSRIARLVGGEVLPKSIFDPRVQ